MNYHLRELEKTDAKSLIGIFNYYVANSLAAFRDKQVGIGYFERIWAEQGELPAVAVETEDGKFIGYGRLSPYKPVSTLSKTAVITYFIMPDHTGAGLGTRVLDYLVERARPMGIDRILASISSPNEASIEFHKRNGFVECGRFPEVAKKNGIVFDLLWMVKKI